MDDDGEARFMALVGQLLDRAPSGVSPLDAVLLVALHLGIADDSRSLANRLGVAHALVLREIAGLSDCYLRLRRRDGRTQRSWIELTQAARSLLRDNHHPAG